MFMKRGGRLLPGAFLIAAATFVLAGPAHGQFRGKQFPGRSAQNAQPGVSQMMLQQQIRAALNPQQQTASPAISPGGPNGPQQQGGSQKCSPGQGQTPSQSQGSTAQNNSTSNAQVTALRQQQTTFQTALQQQQAGLQTALQQTNNALTTLQQQQSQIPPQQYNTLLTALQQRQSDLQNSLQQVTAMLTALQQQSGQQTTYQP